MSDPDTLRLAAKISDEFSGPLRDMQRSLRSFAAQTAGLHKQGIAAAKDHGKAFHEMQRSVHELTDRVKGGLTPAMAAFGFTSLSVAGAIAAVTKSVVDFGANARNLSNLAKFSGFSADAVQGLEELSEGLGSTKADMDTFIKSFSTNMDQFKRYNRGALAEGLFKIGPAGFQFASQLKNAGTQAERMNLIFDFLASNKWSAVQKKILTDAIGLPEAFAHAGAGARELYKALNQEIKPLDPGWEARARRYNESIALLKTSVGNLALHIGDDLSGSFARMGDLIRTFIDENGPQIQKFVRDIGKWIEDADWQQFGKDIRDVAVAVKDVATGFGQLKAVFDEFRGGEKIDLKEFIDFSGLGQTLEIFVAVWKARWAQFRASLGVGSQSEADTAEAERRDMLKRYRPGDLEEEDRTAAARAKTDTREIAKQKELTPGWQPSDKTELQKLRDWWGGTAVPAEAAPAAPAAPAAAAPSDKTWLQRMREGLFHKESYTGGFEAEGPNPLRAAQSSIRFPTEETLGGAKSTGDAVETIAVGTRKGVYDGMWDFYNSYNAVGGATAAPSAARAIKASLGDIGGGALEQRGGGALPGGAEAPEQRGGGAETLGGAGQPGKGDPRGMLAAVRQAAIRHGINPDLMEKVARGEGLAGYTGDAGTSFGAMQLHRGGPGSVGTEYEKATGHSLTDRKYEPEQIEFAAKWIKQHGWGAWSAARNQGITGRMGVGIDTSKWANELRPKPTTLEQIRKSVEGMKAAGGIMPGAETAVGGGPPKAFIMHHTGGRGTVEGVQNTLRQRGLGVEYVMDRDGNIVHTGGPGSANIMPGWGPKGAGLNNANIVGMEIIAKNDRDVTKAQIAASQAFIKKNYPNTPVYGHGEVNPGHKEADEGLSVANAIRQQREAEAARSQETAALHGAELRRHFGHPTSEWQRRIKKAISGGGLNEWNSSWARGPQGTIPGRELTEGIKAFDQKRNDQDMMFERHQLQLRGQQASLLDDARKAGMAGTMNHKVTGRAGVDINLTGFPRGTTARTTSEGIFSEVRLGRGRIPYADREA